MNKIAVTIPAPVGLGKDTPARRQNRAELVRTLWDRHGRRRLPPFKVLWNALSGCDPRDVFWVCEMNSGGPIYFLPTREWIGALVLKLQAMKMRRVLEVGAGDGFLSACLARRRLPFKLFTTDNAAWQKPQARMTRQERQALRHIAVPGLTLGPNVEPLDAVQAVQKYKPDLVLVSWPPPGLLVEKLIKSPTRYVLDISVDGDVCGNGTKTWRFNKDFLEGALETRALCRLDNKAEPPNTRVTLYYGKRHREYEEEAW